MPAITPRPESPGLLTYDQAAGYLNVNKTFLYKEVSARRLRAVKLGHRSVRFRRQDLDAYVERKAA